MEKDAFLNDVASRSFMEQADKDYILARLAHKNELFSQYHWSGLQALEKYIKAILLFNRIPSLKMGHDLLKGLELLQEISFINLQDMTKEIIKHFNTYGCNRYLTYSYVEYKYYLGNFDFAIWDIRKYCRPLDTKYTKIADDLIHEQLKIISSSSLQDVKSVYIEGGLLEKILQDKNHPARKALIWQNPCFFLKNRKTVKQKEVLHGVNSPLTLHPEYLDELTPYVKIHQSEKDAYRKESERRKLKKIN
jgi:HEPN domain-containing protein